jgi:hypothetical protein
MTRRSDDFDFDGTLDVLRDNLGKADAFITAAEELIERSWCGDGGEDNDDDSDDNLSRRRNQVAHLVESAKLAVRGAIYAGEELAKPRPGV